MSEINSWLSDLFLWTFDHEIITGIFIIVPLVLWVIIGLFVVLYWGAMNEEAISWKRAFGVVFGIYALTPILYWLLTGYIGNMIYG